MNVIETQRQLLSEGTGREIVQFANMHPSADVPALQARILTVGDALDLERFARIPGATMRLVEERLLTLNRAASLLSARPEFAAATCAVQQWIFENQPQWRVLAGPVHGLGSGIANRPVKNVAGGGNAVIYSAKHADGAILSAEYFSEGRNACCMQWGIVDGATASDAEALASLMCKFMQGVELAIGQTYGVCLLSQETQEEQDPTEPDAPAQ